MRPFGFPRQNRLLKAKDFSLLHKKGKRFYTEHFIIYIMPTNFGYSRLGVSINAKTGNAVKRNRLKRLLREFFRLNQRALNLRADIHITVKRGIKASSIKGLGELSEEIKETLASLFVQVKLPETDVSE